MRILLAPPALAALLASCSGAPPPPAPTLRAYRFRGNGSLACDKTHAGESVSCGERSLDACLDTVEQAHRDEEEPPKHVLARMEAACARGEACGCAFLGEALLVDGSKDPRRGLRLLEDACRSGADRACDAGSLFLQYCTHSPSAWSHAACVELDRTGSLGSERATDWQQVAAPRELEGCTVLGDTFFLIGVDVIYARRAGVWDGAKVRWEALGPRAIRARTRTRDWIGPIRRTPAGLEGGPSPVRGAACELAKREVARLPSIDRLCRAASRCLEGDLRVEVIGTETEEGLSACAALLRTGIAGRKARKEAEDCDDP